VVDIEVRLRDWNRTLNDGKERMELLKTAADTIASQRKQLAAARRTIESRNRTFKKWLKIKCDAQ
jgi:small-conductance mechanosensitive channel